MIVYNIYMLQEESEKVIVEITTDKKSQEKDESKSDSKSDSKSEDIESIVSEYLENH